MRVMPNEDAQRRWRDDDGEALRYEYALTPDDVVIDLGAYRGEWAEEIYRRYRCKLILVEPTPCADGFPHGELINKAAATYDGTMKFGGAYYYTSAHEQTTHEFECFDINHLLSKYADIALLKVNIEGEEYRLLKHIIAADLHLRIRNIQVQFHEILGQPYMQWYDELVKLLSFTHRLTYHYSFCWENWQRCAT